MAFLQRRIEVTISLSSTDKNPTTGETVTGSSSIQSFEGGGNTVTLPSLRTSARIHNAGGPLGSTMELTIFGMTESMMNRLSTLGMQINLVPKNQIVVSAGDETNGLSTVFFGYIIAAYADFNRAPEVAFQISAQSLFAQSAIPVAASSFKGATDVATIMSGLATQMGLRFENNGVQVKLPSPYFSGSAKTQALKCVKDANISWNGGEGGVLAIWPKNGSRGGAIPVVEPPGMIQYPTYTAYGIIVRSVYNPSIAFGGRIQVNSSLKPATGVWAIYGLDLALDAQLPNGKWEMMISGYNPKFPAPVLAAVGR
jgi:hypothetical protein